VAKRIFSYPVVKRNFNPSHQGASLPSTISLKLILEILLRRYFDGTDGEDFQLLRRVARFYSAASLSRDIYLSRDFAVVITFVIDPVDAALFP